VHNIATMESNRRIFMKAGFAAAILPQTSGVTSSVPGKRRIRQSVSRWCYKQIPLDQLCVAAAQMGLKGVDLLEVAEFEIPRRYGLICTMGMPEAGRFRMR
jgi:hydroxypyruvate isomerase